MIEFRFARLKGHPSDCTIHQNLGCVQKIQLLEVGSYLVGPRSYMRVEAIENIYSKILLRSSLYMRHRYLHNTMSTMVMYYVRKLIGEYLSFIVVGRCSSCFIISVEYMCNILVKFNPRGDTCNVLNEYCALPPF